MLCRAFLCVLTPDMQAATTLFLIGVILILLAQIRKNDQDKQSVKQDILTNERSDNTIVYKYLPRDIDSYYRELQPPSKLYSDMF
jgi:uncharacterized membrane protein